MFYTLQKKRLSDKPLIFESNSFDSDMETICTLRKYRRFFVEKVFVFENNGECYCL